jgi:hypothetical protein
MFKFLSQQWASLAGVDQTTWDERASARSYSPFNGYVQVGMSRWSEGKAPSQVDPATEAATPSIPSAASIAGSGQERQLTILSSDDTDNWGYILYGADGSAPTGLNSEAIAVVAHVNDTSTVYTILGVPVDFDTFGIKTFSVDGVLTTIDALPIV